MIKTFGKVVYNTETAELVYKYVKGAYGDPAGYEEILFKNENGSFFVYGNGGEESIYPVEKITRIAKDKTEAWIEERK